MTASFYISNTVGAILYVQGPDLGTGRDIKRNKREALLSRSSWATVYCVPITISNTRQKMSWWKWNQCLSNNFDEPGLLPLSRLMQSSWDCALNSPNIFLICEIRCWTSCPLKSLPALVCCDSSLLSRWPQASLSWVGLAGEMDGQERFLFFPPLPVGCIVDLKPVWTKHSGTNHREPSRIGRG